MGRVDDARAWMACHYEAGRAMARWWGGVEIQTIDMPWGRVAPTIAQPDAARSGLDALDRFLYEQASDRPLSIDGLPDRARVGLARMEVALVTCYAGSVAWARHRKRTVASCLARDGRADAERARAISEAHFAMPERLDHSAALSRQTAFTYATELVRSRQGWAAVAAIAEALWILGRVDAQEIDALCLGSFGEPLPPGP